MKYGVTEVYVKHNFYSNLRIKLCRTDENGQVILCKDLGDHCEEVEPIETKQKRFPLKKGFFLYELDESYFYIYEDGEYSMYRYKYIKHVGSSRSSKTFSLIEEAIQRSEQNKGYRTTVWRDSRESLGNTVWVDIEKVFMLSNRSYRFTKNTTPIKLPNGATIEPHGDDTTNAHGLTQDVAWLNEPYKMIKDTFDQIDQRANQIWIDINPKGLHWSDDLDTHPRCKVIHSTFKENPFCPPDQRAKILSYDPSNPINVDNGTANEMKWLIYGLGLKAENPNRIFNWKQIDDAEYHKLNVPVYVGVDWGKVDPFGILEVKYLDGCLYLHELNYASENEIRATLSDEDRGIVKKAEQQEDSDIVAEQIGIVYYVFSKMLKIKQSTPIICDNNRPIKIAMLRRMGFDAHEALKPKGSILDGIDVLDNLKVYYTKSSKNIEQEQEDYTRKTDKFGNVEEEPIDANNHTIDPARYVASHLVKLGIIKSF